MAIDAALAQKPTTLDELLEMLRQAGIEVSPRGKSIRLKAPGQKRFVRLDADSVGEDYSVASLLAVIAGEKAHATRKKYPPHRSAEGESAGGYSGKTPGRKGRRVRAVGQYV